jgi:CBS domain containing-hemolysin-like protein
VDASQSDLASGVVGLAVLVLLILINAFFVLSEFSLINVERSRVERMARSGDRRAARLLHGVQRLTRQLSGTQLGISVSSLLVGFLAEPALATLIRPPLGQLPILGDAAVAAIAFALAYVISNVTQLVLGEQVPKNLAIAHPMRFAMLTITPLDAFCVLCRPLIAMLNGAAGGIVRLMGVEPRSEISASRSIEELEVVIRTSAEDGTLDRATARLLRHSARFRSKTAADALVPRVAIAALPRSATAADLLRQAAETGHIRFPVHDGGLDRIAGVASVMDVLQVPIDGRASVTLDELMEPVGAVPESLHLDALLRQMRHSGAFMVVVVDEYGGTAGIVTREDLMEEAAGEIDARPQRPPDHGGEGRLLPGAASLEQVHDETGLDLPEGEYATLAGFLLYRLGELPAPGQRVRVGRWTLEAVTVTERRIAWVSIGREHNPDEEEARG